MVFLKIIRSFCLNSIHNQRIPLIKFRAGVASGTSHPITAQSVGVSGSHIDKPGKVYSAGPVLEDHELPPKYRRRMIDQHEVDYINRGGPDEY